ncbi:MAG: DUF4097 family beta strand repeat protein [Gemmatimonadales bacterium]|nr:DUF4097 family beta strand repeat protein [Gemmatimonadales bacterium]
MTRALALAVAFATLTGTISAQATRFTRQLAPGALVELDNINGSISVSQGTGRTAEVVVTKTVKKGDGNMVKAIMEEENGVMRVCTIYLNRDPNRSSCRGNNSTNSKNGDRFEVTMNYVVRLPAGVRVRGETVNGSITVSAIDAQADLETVNGDIRVQSGAAGSLQTVNGSIRGSFARADWPGALRMETVNGAIELEFPANLAATVRGETVNGSISSPDFPVTITGKWGPKSFRGTIGGGGRDLQVETVNGNITIRKR